MKNKNILLISVIILSIIGIIMITSSSIIWAEYKFDDPYKYMKSQILFFLISIILMFFISKIDYKLYTCDLNKKVGKKLVDNTSLKDIELDNVSTFIYVNNDNTIYQMEFKLNDKSSIKVNYSRYENTTLNDEFDITNSKIPVIGG